MANPSLTSILRRRLVLMFLVPGILCLGLVGFLAASREMDLQEEQNMLVVDSVNHYVDSYLVDAVRGLEFLANNSDHSELEETDRDMRQFRHAFPFYEKLMLVDRDNTILLSIPGGITGIDMPRPHPRESGTPNGIASLPYISPDSGHLVVFAEHRSPSGRSVAGELDLESLQQFLLHFWEGREGEVLLTDSYGNIIVHPDESQVRQQMNIGGTELFIKAKENVRSSFFHRQESRVFFSSAGRIHEVDWLLVITKPAWTVYRSILRGIGLLCVVVFPPVLLFFMLVHRDMLARFARPMRSFARAIRQVGRGEAFLLEGNAPSFNELDEIESEFRLMSDNLVQREAALKASEAKYRNIIDNAVEGIFQSLPGGRFRDVNPALARILGYGSPEQLLREVTDIGSQLYFDAKERDAMLEKIRQDGAMQTELRVKRRDGSPIWILMQARLVRDKQGNVRYIEGFVQDITERRQSLELMVQTEKMLTVGGLASGMAHELNNPLASIVQNAQILQRRLDITIRKNKVLAREAGLEEEGFEMFCERQGIPRIMQGIHQEGVRAARIIQDMLSFSRKSNSRAELHDLNGIIEESIELAGKDYDLNKHYDFRKIRIVRDFGKDLGRVMCNGSEVQQVMLNLLKNAAQALREDVDTAREPEIRIRTRRLDGQVEIRVEDNGPGMSQEVRNKVFEPFFTTKEPGAGTGLGLFVSYYLITQKHDGTISVASEAGQGTSFIIRLHAAEDERSRDRD